MTSTERARRHREKIKREQAVAAASQRATEHSRAVVDQLVAERDLTVSEQELVRQIGAVIAELEEMDRILRYRTTEWLTAAVEEVEEQFGPGIQVVLNVDPMLVAVDRKRTLLKGLIGELRQHLALAARLGPASGKAPTTIPESATTAAQPPAATALSVVPDDDFDLFGAG